MTEWLSLGHFQLVHITDNKYSMEWKSGRDENAQATTIQTTI